MHKAIRRLTPAPKARVQRRSSEDPGRVYSQRDNGLLTADNVYAANGHDIQHKISDSTGAISNSDSNILSSSPKTTTFMMRRSSAGVDGQMVNTTVPVRANFEDIKQHLKHLGPSNPATNPKNTRSTTVKVKPGLHQPARPSSVTEGAISDTRFEDDDNETTSLLKPQHSGPQVTGKDGIQALRQSYGSVSPAVVAMSLTSPGSDGMPSLTIETVEQANKSTQTPAKANKEGPLIDIDTSNAGTGSGNRSSPSSDESFPASARTDSLAAPKRGNVRSGSITENIIESRGVRKVVLETTSSNDDDDYAVMTLSPERGKQGGKIGNVITAPERVTEAQDDEEEDHLSQDPGEENAQGSQVGEDDGQGGQSSSKAGSTSGKKKSRRKKRKGGRS